MRVRNLSKLLGWSVLALVLAVTGCGDDEIDGLTGPRDETPSSGRYGALGNSLTAGFINSGLIEGAQTAGYPSRIAAQAGWQPLQLPLIAAPGIGSTPGRSGLFVDETGAITTEAVPDPTVLLRNALLPVPYDNLGVPGATTVDLLQALDATTSQAGNNAFFDLILRNSALPPGTFTALDQMAARNPSILTLWIGNNDILGGVLGGNPQVGVNITPSSVWEGLFLSVLASVGAMNADTVAVANIPDITEIPFVRTVPLGVVIQDNLVKWQMAEDTAEDPVQFVLLTAPVSNSQVAPTYLPPPFGTGENTLGSAFTLTASEVAAVSATADAYNVIILREAQSRGWAYVDINTALAVFPNDPTNPANFATINAIFPWLTNPGTGIPFQNVLSAFSLDGIHASELGNGVIANAFIAALNDTYGLAIPAVDLGTIQNVVGFEQAPLAGGTVRFDPQGLAALHALPSLMGVTR